MSAQIDPSKVAITLKRDDYIEAESDGAKIGGKVSHVNVNGLVTIEHLGTFAIHGITDSPYDGDYRTFILTDHQPAPQPEWKPGTVGTATVRGVEGVRVIRASTQHGAWFSANYTDGFYLHPESMVTAFVPDDAEALRAGLRKWQDTVNEAGQYLIPAHRASEGLIGDAKALRADFESAVALSEARQVELEEAKEQAKTNATEAANWQSRWDDEVHERKRLQAEVDRLSDALDAAVERARIANRDARDEYAEVERLRAKTLPTDLTKCICPWDSEDRGGGHSEIVAEYEPACPVHSEHVYDPRQGMWVERAARTLPTREQIADAIGATDVATDNGLVRWELLISADAVVALFEQGGAAPKVTREQAAEVLWLNEHQRPWANANREDRAVLLSAADAVIARMSGAE